MRYNKKNFKKFLDMNCIYRDYDFNAYCEDLEQQYNNTGKKEYELSKFDSIDGLPKLWVY